MKIKKAGLALALAATAMLVLSGCGTMTPEKLAGKIKQAVEKTPYSQAELDMTMDISMSEPTTGAAMDMGVQATGQMRVSYDPQTVYENLEFTIEMLGLQVPMSMEVYAFQEGDKVVSYANMDDTWTRSEVDAASQTAENVSVAIWNLPAEQLAINEDVTELDGTPVLCLTADITGKDVAQTVNLLFNSLEESGGLLSEDQENLETLDWDKISAQVVTYVDSKTYLPLREEVTLSGLDEAMTSQLEGTNVSLSIQNTSVTVNYTSYEPVEPCVLPEGAEEAAG